MICQTCKTSLPAEVNFCPDCGMSTKEVIQIDGKSPLYLIITFYIVDLIFLTTIYFVYQNGSSLTTEIVIEIIAAFIAIGFASVDAKAIIKLYRFPKINVLAVLAMIIIPLITGVTVYYGIEILNTTIFDESSNTYLGYVMYPNPIFWAIFFTTITPPIFEELVYRGFLFNQLQKITSIRVTIILTAFIFALAHFSIISLLWIFPFGLLLGYIRHKYKTLWLGMIIHFIHNLIVLSLDYYYYDNILLDF
ncbi:hypothetical protein GCM10022393_09410 [Aquimarina addita]|uniref:CAAX prenyl protease 2/Lysostaphin resistance protein A-like domain-containing protein n=1 Tax=Aquimarina addita TaxID=870485 RepID=A0ABP7XDN5_9FLAO